MWASGADYSVRREGSQRARGGRAWPPVTGEALLVLQSSSSVVLVLDAGSPEPGESRTRTREEDDKQTEPVARIRGHAPSLQNAWERPKLLSSPRRGSARRAGAHCRQWAPSTNPNLGDQSPRPPGIYRFRATAAPGNNERANVFWCCGGPKAVNPGGACLPAGSGAKPPSAWLRATHRISRTWDALKMLARGGVGAYNERACE
jgi:hypothetical protein